MSIKKTEFYEGGDPFVEATAGIDKLTKEALELDKVITKLAGTLKNDLSKANLDNSKNIKANNALQKKAITVINEKKKVTQTLSALEKERIKTLAQQKTVLAQNLVQNEKSNKILQKGKLLLADERKALKQKLQLQRAERGSEEQLIKVNAILTERRRKLGTVNAKNKVTHERLTRAISRNTASLMKQDGQVLKNQRHVGNYGRAVAGLKKNFAAMAIGITAAIAIVRRVGSVFTNAIGTFIKFEFEMAKVKAVSGATSSEMSKLRKQAKELGATSQNSASQVASLQLSLSKKGFNSSEIEAATASINALSIATGEDLATSATVVAGNIKAFGLEASEATRVSNVMAKAFSSSALDLEKFKTATASAGTVLKTSGQSVEEMTSQLGVLVDRNIDASSAGTSLRNIYLELEKRGISASEAFKMINESATPASKAMELFGKRGAVAGVILAQNQEETANLTKELNNSAGAAKRMADIMSDNLAGDTKAASSAVEGLQIAFGEATNDLNRLVVKGFTNAVTAIREFISGNTDAIKPLKNIIIGLKILTPAIIAYTLATSGSIIVDKLKIFWNKKVIASFKKLYITMMANPFAAIAALVAAIGAAIYLYTTRTTAAEKAQKRLNDVSKEATKGLVKQESKLLILKKQLGESSKQVDFLKDSMDGLTKGSTKYILQSNLLKKAEEKRNGIIETINTNFGDYLENNVKATDEYEDQVKALDKVNAALKEQIKIKSLEAITGDIMAQMIDVQTEITKLEMKGQDAWAKEHESFWKGGLAEAELSYFMKLRSNKEHLDSLLKQHQAYEDALNKIKLDDDDDDDDGTETTETTETPEITEATEATKRQTLANIELLTSFRSLFREIDSGNISEFIKSLTFEDMNTDDLTELASLLEIIKDVDPDAFSKLMEIPDIEVPDAVIAPFLFDEELESKIDGFLGSYDETFETITDRYAEYYDYLNSMREVDADNEEKYSQAIVRAKKKENAEKTKIAEEFFRTSAQFAQQGSNLVSNLITLEQSRYQDSENATTAEKESNAAKRKEIAKKYADFQMAANIAEIASNTALGITAAIASPGFPAAAFLIPIIAANGLLQSGIAVAERNNIKSLGTGGYGDSFGHISGDRHSAPSGGEDFKDNIKVEDGEDWSVWNRRTSSVDGARLEQLTNHVNSHGLDDYLARNTFVSPTFSSNFDNSGMIREQRRTNELLGKQRNIFIDKLGNEIQQDLDGNRKIIRK